MTRHFGSSELLNRLCGRHPRLIAVPRAHCRKYFARVSPQFTVCLLSAEQTSVTILAQVFLQASPVSVNASSRATTLSLSAATRLDILFGWVTWFLQISTLYRQLQPLTSCLLGGLLSAPVIFYSVPSVAATDTLSVCTATDQTWRLGLVTVINLQ